MTGSALCIRSVLYGMFPTLGDSSTLISLVTEPSELVALSDLSNELLIQLVARKEKLPCDVKCALSLFYRVVKNCCSSGVPRGENAMGVLKIEIL